jgi:hypothetical protein
MMGSKLLREGDTEKGFAGFINRQFEKVRVLYTRVLGNTLNYRPVVLTLWLIVVALIFPFYMFSQKELAPAEDQSFLFAILQGSANSTIEQTKLFADQVDDIYRSVPEFVASFQIIFPSGGFGGMIVKPFNERDRGVQEIVMDVSGKSAQIPGIRVIQMVPPSLPGNQGFPVDVAIVSTAEPAQLAEIANGMVMKAMQSGIFMFADTDLKFDQPQARAGRPRSLDAPRRQLRESLQHSGPQLQGHSARAARGSAHARPALADLHHRREQSARAAIDVRHARDVDRAARAEAVPAAQRRSHSGRDSAERVARHRAQVPGRRGRANTPARIHTRLCG